MSKSVRKDSNFKKSVSVTGYEKYNITGFHSDVIKYYKPDAIFTNTNNKKEFIIMECSSTGDRKVHIGELMQFLTFVSLEYASIENVSFTLFLCGSGTTSPTVDNEYQRLKCYFDNYPIKPEVLKKIKGIYITDTTNYVLDIKTISAMKNIMQ